MRIDHRFLRSVITAASLSIAVAAQPARCNEWTDMFKSILLKQPVGQAPQDNISQRDAQLSNKIIDAVNANKLTVGQTQTLKTQVDNFKQLEIQYRNSNGGLDSIESATLNAELNRINSSLDQMLAGSGATVPVGGPGGFAGGGFPGGGSSAGGGFPGGGFPGGPGGRGGFPGGGMSNDAIVATDARFDSSLRKVTEALASGKLTINEARKLKAEWDAIVSERNSLRADGSLSSDDQIKLDAKLDHLRDSLRANMHDTQAWPGIDGQQAAQAQRITDGMNQGKINQREYNDLKAETDRIASAENRARANGLQFDETLALAIAMENFRGLVDQKLNNVGGGPGNTGPFPGGGGPSTADGINTQDSRFDNKLPKLTALLASGKLTINEARKLKAEFDAVVNERNQLKADGRLTMDEQIRLDAKLDRLRDNINSNTNDKQSWPGINGQQTIQAQRIVDGIKEGKISQREFNDLKAEADRIASDEARARANGLQFEETLALAIAMENFRTLVDQKLNVVGGGPGNTGPIGPGASFDNKQTWVMNRIQQGQASGKLSNAEADDLKADFRRLAELERSFRQSDNSLSTSEIGVLERGLNKIVQELNERVGNDVADAFPEINKKQRELRKRVDDNAASGRLSAQDAKRLRADLEFIDSVEQSFKQSGGNLDRTEADRLNGDLDRLSAKIDRMTGGGRTALQKIDTRKAELLKQIDDGSKSGKLNFRETRILREQFNRIGFLQQQLAMDGSIDDADALRLNTELDQLNTSISGKLTNVNRSPYRRFGNQ